jgi:hypothetical protein
MECSLAKFKARIDYYKNQFDEQRYPLEIYYDVVNSPQLNENQLKDILCWKIRPLLKYQQLALRHKKLIDRAIGKIEYLNLFKLEQISNNDFDNIIYYISPHGVIVRLFILHICKPIEFPLFDQHVYRAFNCFQTNQIYHGIITNTIVKNDYLNYKIFFLELCKEFSLTHSPKEIDSALMMYGKKLKKQKLIT